MQEPSQDPEASVGGDPLEELVRRAAAGDDSAWIGLDRALRPRLLALVRRHFPRALAGPFDTEDVVQDVLLRLAVGLRSFEPRAPGSFLAWLRALIRSSRSVAARRLARKLPAPRMIETQGRLARAKGGRERLLRASQGVG